MKKDNIKIIKNGNRTSFIPIDPNLKSLKKMYKEEDIHYGKYNNDIKKADIKIGLEFEFYPETKTGLNNIISALSSFGKEVVFCPDEFNIQDKELNVWHIEKDRTLESPVRSGYEIVSPKIGLEEAPFYIKNVLNIIREYGYTDDTCGFHFHISSDNEELKNLKPSKLMLFLDENKTLEAWKNRTEFNKDLMDIFKQTNLNDFDANFNKISRFYTLVSRSRYNIANHMEVRAMGGSNYEKKEDLILKDFNEFVQSYYIGCHPSIENEKYNSLKEEFNRNNESLVSPVTLVEVIDEAKKKYVDFDEMTPFEQEVIVERQIFDFEESKRFVPIKELLNETKEYINKKILEEEAMYMDNDLSSGPLY